MNLHQVDVVGLEAAERVFQLLLRGRGSAAVDLGHQEGLLAVAVLEGAAHAALAFAVVVVPAVVQEVDARVECGADDADALVLGDLRRADVVAADADDGDGMAGAAEGTARDLTRGGDSLFAEGDEGGEGGGGFEEVASLHDLHLLCYAMPVEPAWSLCARRPAD